MAWILTESAAVGRILQRFGVFERGLQVQGLSPGVIRAQRDSEEGVWHWDGPGFVSDRLQGLAGFRRNQQVSWASAEIAAIEA